MRDLEMGLRFIQELIWILVGMAMVSPLWLYYPLVKGLHSYILQTFGVSDDPLRMIRLSKILLVELGMVVPLYGVAEALSDIGGAWERYVR